MSLEQYCKRVCPWCDDGFPIVHDGDDYLHDVRVARTSPDADPYVYCEAAIIRAAVAEAVAEEREQCAHRASLYTNGMPGLATWIRARIAADAEEEK